MHKNQCLSNSKSMKYIIDEDFIAKKLFDAEIKDVNKLLKEYFVVKQNRK